jgi:hypothetical protein
MVARTAVVLISICALVGCTSMRTIPDVSPTGIQQEVQPGDEIHVVLQDGRKFDLEVTRVDADTLTGVSDSGKTFRIRYDAVRWLEVAETDGGGIVGGIIGGVGAVYLAALTLFAVMVATAD